MEEGTGWSGAQSDGRVSASVNLPLYHKVRSSVLAPAHLGGPGKRAVKWLWCVGGIGIAELTQGLLA